MDKDDVKLIKVLRPDNVVPKFAVAVNDEVYKERRTVKAIIINQGKIALIKMKNTLLPGGGLESDESLEECIKREVREELGIDIRIVGSIGKVIAFKDVDKEGQYKKYEVICILCEFVEEIKGDMVEGEIMWLTAKEALLNLSEQYSKLSKIELNINTLLNLKTHIYFIKEYISISNYKNKNFDAWNNLKKISSIRTDNDVEDFYFSEREVWWLEMGVNIGHEQDGKGESFLRPVVILKKINKFTFIGVPLSSVQKKDKNIHELIIKLKNKDSSIVNFAITSQVRIFDVRRVKYQM